MKVDLQAVKKQWGEHLHRDGAILCAYRVIFVIFHTVGYLIISHCTLCLAVMHVLIDVCLLCNCIVKYIHEFVGAYCIPSAISLKDNTIWLNNAGTLGF